MFNSCSTRLACSRVRGTPPSAQPSRRPPLCPTTQAPHAHARAMTTTVLHPRSARVLPKGALCGTRTSLFGRPGRSRRYAHAARAAPAATRARGQRHSARTQPPRAPASRVLMRRAAVQGSATHALMPRRSQRWRRVARPCFVPRASCCTRGRRAAGTRATRARGSTSRQGSGGTAAPGTRWARRSRHVADTRRARVPPPHRADIRLSLPHAPRSSVSRFATRSAATSTNAGRGPRPIDDVEMGIRRRCRGGGET